MSKPRYKPPQDYGPLFTPEQIAAIRKARKHQAEHNDTPAPGHSDNPQWK